MRKISLFLIIISITILHSIAKEGMWIPTLLQKYNIEEMQKMGFRLSAEDVYSINNASLKDAVVIFGRGCTGEVISDDGLLITNHHCGYGAVQSHSTVEHDYLTDGFWAMSRKEELSNKNLSVKFLISMEDVTERVLKGVTNDMDENSRKDSIATNMAIVKEEILDSSNYIAQIKPLFYGNQYFVYVYEEFKDVRLVGAPPSSIGKFGGDTDNWMWPRHTGDFSLFRIYADKDNNPAEYSPDNIPYKPKKFFPISMKGYNKDDFTLIFGYPGTTQEYIPSQGVDLIMNQSDPAKIAIRTVKLNILSADMKEDRAVRIKYASKYARTSNSWKKWKGEIKGLNRLNAVEVKREFENVFANWVAENSIRGEKYGNVLSVFDSLYNEYGPYLNAYDYYNEIIYRGTDIFSLASKIDVFNKAVSSGDSTSKSKASEALNTYIESYYKDYNQTTDEKIFSALLKKYGEDLSPEFLPEFFIKLVPEIEEEKFLKKYYRKSVLADSAAVLKKVAENDIKAISKIEKDNSFKLYKELKQHYKDSIQPKFLDITRAIKKNQKLYMEAILEMNEGERLMADANLTLRVSYGKVEGYTPRDGMEYNYFTTLDGIIEKDNPEIYDYNIPERLREIFRSKEFGNYTNHTGNIPVAFCASNHTTGGNSGSPVLNADGHLIGVNFDRCWEGTMSDIMFDPAMCRNIMIDIRYALFIIDKYAGAGYLLEEMEIIK
jgi:hypothetical protein